MNIDEITQEQVDLMVSAVLRQNSFLQASCPKEHDKYAEFGEKLDRINRNIDRLVELGLIVELHGDDVSESITNARSIFRGFNFRAFSVTNSGLLLFQEIMKPEDNVEDIKLKGKGLPN